MLRALGLLLLLLMTVRAEAGSWRPGWTWRSIQTPHFVITYHQGEEDLAAEMAIVAEEVHTTLSPWMRWTPFGRTQIVLADATDDSNGFAQTIPNNAITLYAVPPRVDMALDNHQDWLWSLFVHEYAHVLQIDTIGGLPRGLRVAFGRLIMPGAVLPSWMTEGYATWIETRTTGGGRGRSTFADALLRLASLEGRFPPIDSADGFGTRWPWGQTRYLYGVRFHQFVAGRHGPDSWIDFHHRHGRGLIPFILPSREAFGETLISMWAAWKEEMGRHYRDEARRIASQGSGLSASRVLPTRSGVATEPHYSPDGNSVLYGHGSPSERGGLRALRLDGGSDRRILRSRGTGVTAMRGGRALIWSQGAFTDDWTTWNDLYTLDIEPDGSPKTRGKLKPPARARRMSVGERLFDPAPHPKEDFWFAVQAVTAGNRLVRVDPITLPDGEKPRRGEDRVTVTPILTPQDGSTFSGLVWDPSGERLALGVNQPGGYRDIHVIDRDGRLLRTLSWDRAIDADPEWTPDGEHLLWASDRDGVWNLWAYRWNDGSTWRVTRVLGAARHPDVAPDGRSLVFQGLGPQGWRVEEIVLDPARWEEAPLPVRSLPGPDWGPSAQALHPLGPTDGVPGPDLPSGTGPDDAVRRDQARSPWTTPASDPTPPPPALEGSRPYNPFRTLFPPRVLEPWGAITEGGLLLGLSTWGRDVVGTASWGASIHYRTDTGYLGWGASVGISPLRPLLGISYSTSSLDYGRLWLVSTPPGRPGGTVLSGIHRGQDRYIERRDLWVAGVSVPYRDHRFSARYKFELREPLHELPDFLAQDVLPAQGSFSGLVLGWTVSDIDRWASSISSEEGGAFSLSVDLESSALGAFRVQPDGTLSPLHRAIVTAEGRGYLPMPWRGNHVLAVRGVAGATLGTQIPQRTFRLGGSYGDSPYLSLPDRYYALRGYPTSALRGDHLWLASAEYRMPLFHIERGIVTVPVWFRSIALSVFAEAGAAFLDEDVASGDQVLNLLRNTRPAVGVELLADGVILWGSGLTGRFGYGLGFGSGSYPSGAFYAQLGGSF